jgi:hypothetical protein
LTQQGVIDEFVARRDIGLNDVPAAAARDERAALKVFPSIRTALGKFSILRQDAGKRTIQQTTGKIPHGDRTNAMSRLTHRHDLLWSRIKYATDLTMHPGGYLVPAR